MDSPALFIVVALELALLIGGSMLLWRLGLSAKARALPAALPPWEISSTDFIFFLWLVICGGFALPFAASLWFKEHPLSLNTSVIVSTALLHVGMLTGVLTYKLCFRGKFPARFPDPAPTPPNPVLAGFATYLISLPVVAVVSLAWQGILTLCHVPAPPQDAIDILRHASPLPRALLLASAIGLAPITEEMIFRAGLFRFVRTRLPRKAALLLPALLFSAIHTNLASFLPLAALGVVFSLAYERTGRISTTIIAHALFNVTTTVLVLVGIDM